MDRPKKREIERELGQWSALQVNEMGMGLIA